MRIKIAIISTLFLILVCFQTGHAIVEHSIDLVKAEEILLQVLGVGTEGGSSPDFSEATGDLPFEIVGYTNLMGIAPSGEAYNYYFVQPGDTLYKIAQKYQSSVEVIKLRNGLRSDYLYVGQRLVIPFSGESDFIYYVKPGDSLYLLARQYNTTIAVIKDINGLYSNYIYSGQKLRIPLVRPRTTFTYTVRSGDTLYAIARRFAVSMDRVKSYNNLRSNYLWVGQQLTIPLSVSDRSRGRIAVTKEEIDLMARAVYSEARGEPFQGQVAVAAVVINRVLHPLFPDTVRGVIFQPWQFTAVHDGQFWLQPDQQAYRAVEYALNGWDPSQGAIYYYNPRTATSRWVFYRTVIIKIGEHYFAV